MTATDTTTVKVSMFHNMTGRFAEYRHGDILAPTDTYTFDITPGTTTEGICDRSYAGLNRGSGAEFDGFLDSPFRSLSVGDVLVIERERLGNKLIDTYTCTRFGWTEVQVTDAELDGRPGATP